MHDKDINSLIQNEVRDRTGKLDLRIDDLSRLLPDTIFALDWLERLILFGDCSEQVSTTWPELPYFRIIRYDT